MPRFNILLISITLFILPLSACASPTIADPVELANRKVKIVTTVGMITDVVRNVGGDRVEIIGLMGPGVDPHLYKASEGDVVHLGEADVIFYVGLHLEAAMGRVLERIHEYGGNAVAVSGTIDRGELLTPPEFEGAYDPHIWFDVRLWSKTVEVVRDTLVEVDPTHAKTYLENAESFLFELEGLHAYVLGQVEKVPPEQRVLITAHDAFNYFGRAYGFEVRGLQGISTATEASTADVSGLVEFIVANKIPAIFIESSVPQRNVEAVQAAARSQGLAVVIGGELFSDAMGNPGTEEGTYIGMVKHNIDTIVSALSIVPTTP